MLLPYRDVFCQLTDGTYCSIPLLTCMVPSPHGLVCGSFGTKFFPFPEEVALTQGPQVGHRLGALDEEHASNRPLQDCAWTLAQASTQRQLEPVDTGIWWPSTTAHTALPLSPTNYMTTHVHDASTASSSCEHHILKMRKRKFTQESESLKTHTACDLRAGLRLLLTQHQALSKDSMLLHPPCPTLSDREKSWVQAGFASCLRPHHCLVQEPYLELGLCCPGTSSCLSPTGPSRCLCAWEMM